MRWNVPLVLLPLVLVGLSGCLADDEPKPAAGDDGHDHGPEPHAPDERPAEPTQLFDRYEERPVGIERSMRLLYGPYPIPAGSDFNRVTLDLPMQEGFITAISPNLYDAGSGITPSNQDLHIHHAHWFRMSDDPEDEYYTLNLAWVFGTGEERTQGSLHDRAEADPDGPRYGIYMEPDTPQALIFMLHNKNPDPALVYVALDVTFVYGSAPDLAAATGCPDRQSGETCRAGGDYHTLHGTLWGTTFDVPRERLEDGGDGVYIHPQDIAAGDSTRRASDGLGRMFTASASGVAIASAGHLHPNGREVIVANLGPEGSACEADLDGDGLPGVTLFRSTKIEGEPAAWPHSADYQMGATKHGWRAPIHAGDRITQFAVYDNDDYASYEAMSFVGLYIDRAQAPPARSGQCVLEDVAPILLAGDPWGGDPTETVVNRGGDGHAHSHGANCDVPGGPACNTEMGEPAAGLETDVVTIADFTYTPGGRSLDGAAGNPVQVGKGDVLRFVNADASAGIRHTVTSCEWPCNGPYMANYPRADGTFDSGKLGNTDPLDGGTVETAWPVFELDTSELETGHYAIYCRVHPWMRGALEVV